MSLKAILETLEGMSDDVKEHYKERDDKKFYLDVTKTDGVALENVDGLKTTVEKLRQSEKTLQKEVKSVEDQLRDHRAKYDGIDPESAKNALAKISEIKDWDGETKVKEAVEVAVSETNQRMQLKIDEILKQNKEKEISLTTELDSSQEQLRSAVVTSKIIEAISKEKGNVDLLMPHVKSHVQMIKNSQGQFVPEVINAEGGPRVNSSGKDMTIVEFVQEMKVNDTFAAAFPGANSTGSGKQNSNSAPPKKNDEKVIKAGDAKGLSQNLEEIATGKVNVDMTMSD